MLKKKNWANFKELLKFLPKKFSVCSQIYRFGIRDPGSRKKTIPDPGSRGQKGTGSRIRNTGKNQDPGSGINIPDPQHCKGEKKNPCQLECYLL